MIGVLDYNYVIYFIGATTYHTTLLCVTVSICPFFLCAKLVFHCAHTTVYTGLHLLPYLCTYTSIGFLPWKYRCNLRQIVHCFSQSHVLLFENNRETNLLTELLFWIVPIRYMVLNQH